MIQSKNLTPAHNGTPSFGLAVIDTIVLPVFDIMEKPKFIMKLGCMPSKNGKLRYYGLFECPLCGKHFKCEECNIEKGDTRSCGCYKNTKKTLKHGLCNTDVYKLWKKVKNRCCNKNNTAYKDYGGRGITMCEEWLNNPVAFCEWALGNGWEKGLVIDRIDVNGNYEPLNCRFVTRYVSGQNTRLLRVTNKSGYRGVSFSKSMNKWQTQIDYNGKYYQLGFYELSADAAIAYNDFVIENKTNHPLNIILPHE